ncbi:MAG: tRNA 2-thiouridine(34) synthase MnmA, partial [Clostridia bacterium]|nr:tRNA 2-thiouridine(34) synthase MnmA [Clostridia bacterium]MDY6184395.1 tRNA 2-thiouridine(34) synthase MnmA [Eubacteriales bacterium]
MEQTRLIDSAGESVLIAMSGGVDSSVTACLALDSGYSGVGCMMLLPAESSETDTLDARLVCEKLGMPFHVLDYRAEFRREVIGRFVGQYLAGKTPNPCIDCNR